MCIYLLFVIWSESLQSTQKSWQTKLSRRAKGGTATTPKRAVIHREDPGIDRIIRSLSHIITIIQFDTLQNQEHLQPNVITYSAAISACEQACVGSPGSDKGRAWPQNRPADYRDKFTWLPRLGVG